MDDSLKIIKEYANKVERVKMIENEINKGFINVLNKYIES